MGFLIFAAQIAYPIWLGAHNDPLRSVWVYVAILAVALLMFGPRRGEVQGNPSLALRASFALVLSVGLGFLGYGIGALFAP